MYRTDAAGHVANMFSAGNPGLGQQPTQIDASWMNEVQEEIVYVITQAAIALVKGNRHQLHDAIVQLINIHAPVASIPDASTTVKGVIEIATNAEAQGLTDSIRAITASALAAVTATASRTGVIALATAAEGQGLSEATKAITPAVLAAVTATLTRTGIVELATQAEAQGLVDTTRALTADALSAVTATTSRTGIAALATTAEGQAGTDAAKIITAAVLAAVTATTTRAGLIEIATNAEGQALTDTVRAITPSVLAAITATTSRTGIAALATTAEGKAGTDSAKIVTAAVMAAVFQGGEIVYAVDGSASANVLTATLTPAPAAYTTGMALYVKVQTDNTGACTLNVNGLGAKNIKRYGADPAAGVLKDGAVVLFIYDGTNFQAIAGTKSVGGTPGLVTILDNGTIMQVTSVSVAGADTGTASDQTVTWATTYPALCDGVWCTATQPSGGITGGYAAYHNTVTQTGCKVGLDGIGSPPGATWLVYVLSIGH